MENFVEYVNEGRLFGRHGFAALEWEARNLVGDAPLAGGDALEIGAGDGVFSLWMLHAGARSVTSLEPESDGSTNGVSGAAARHRARLKVGEDRWRFLPDTIQAFPAAKTRYSVIMSRASINHIDEDGCVRLLEDPAARARYKAILGKIKDLMTPGGEFIVTDCGRVNYWDRLLKRPSPWAPEIEWEKHQEPETWTALFEEAGFETIESRFFHPWYRIRALGPLLSLKPAARMLSSCFTIRVRKPR